MAPPGLWHGTCSPRPTRPGAKRDSLCAVPRWVLNMPAAKPYGVALARSTTSSSVSNGSAEMTGPKISSRAIRIPSDTAPKTVGSMKLPPSRPGAEARCPPASNSAPSLLPESRNCSILVAWRAEMMGPISVSGCNPSPMRRLEANSATRRINSSWISRATNRREPKQCRSVRNSQIPTSPRPARPFRCPHRGRR